jgi:hypothetical protein
MHIQFRTLTFHSRLEEQLQERLHLKKFATSLLVTMGALDSPLGSHPKSDLVTDLYSGCTSIASMDESDHRIIINRFKESVTSLSTAIGVLSSPLGPHTENNLATNLYSDSTLIDITIGVKRVSVVRCIRLVSISESYWLHANSFRFWSNPL